jgi:hypothetical protein
MGQPHGMPQADASQDAPVFVWFHLPVLVRQRADRRRMIHSRLAGANTGTC